MLEVFFYPKPGRLPPVVSQSAEELLARLTACLSSNAPSVLASLQPGLSEAQISTLETQGHFKLPPDLRSLYRWHNGQSRSNVCSFLPGQRFVPLDEFVEEKFVLQGQLADAKWHQSRAFSLLSGYTKDWIQVFDDRTGDGYFYDPSRAEGSGAFFYRFTEVRYYRWFPSVRNFLEGCIECYETNAFAIGKEANELVEDSQKTEIIWNRLSKGND